MSVSPTPLAPAAASPRVRTLRAIPRIPSGVILAAIVLAGAEIQREVWTTPYLESGERLPVTLLGLVVIGALLVVRRAPLPSLIAGFASFATVDLFASAWDVAPALGFSAMPLAYVLGRRTTGRTRTAGSLVAFAAVAFVAFRYAAADASSDYPIGSAITQVALSLSPIWLGATMRDRAALHEALEASAARAAADREGSLQRTVLDERSRIAGELHDLIAHALSAVIVQAGVARVHATHGASTAADAFAAVETTGRDALTEIRSMLDVLRAPGDHDLTTLEPQPRVEHLPRLLARTNLETELTIEGDERSLPPSVDLTAYRVVQEALELAAAHGASSAHVTVAFEPAGLALTVDDDGAGERPPLATRERVRLYGGELSGQSQRGAENGFRLRARLPIREAA
ncbi:MAG: hypothetical protein J7513_15020 [Solirubrobacteraceae bacterium]|nr:hypothetical protein [Solirubrobacteraceae bacterium]